MKKGRARLTVFATLARTRNCPYAPSGRVLAGKRPPYLVGPE